ncbi:MAG: hypothetical protein AAGG01_20975, partial [Planctomycetota bacterium]
ILTGAVTALGARVNPSTRCVSVEVLFTDLGGSSEQPALPAGSFVRAELSGRPFPRALWVPESWLTYREGEALAFVVIGENDEVGPRVEQRRLSFLSGLHEGGRIITSGLVAGERIATSSLPLLGDGAPVTVLGNGAPDQPAEGGR